ncbi:MAG: hypothetical protein ACLP59_04595 [Bryobacteraceae bacterium]
MQNVVFARRIALAKLQPDGKHKFLHIRVYVVYQVASLYYVLGRLLVEVVAQSKNLHRPPTLKITLGLRRIQEPNQTFRLSGGISRHA